METWKGDEWKRGGGTTWGWYSYDPELNLLYYGTGNPGSWNPDQRPGDNKWSMTIFARNPDTGKAKWAYQKTPHDRWDYDGINEMVLVDVTIKGQPRKVLANFDRNGFAYMLDRATGELLMADPFVVVNWATGVDLKTGRPIENPEKQTSSTKNTKDICPSAMGGKNQQPVAYSPRTNLFYVPTNNLCMDYEGVQVKYQAGQPYVGAIVVSHAGPGGNRGEFIAWDPTTNKKVWGIKEGLANWGGALATGGDVVFYGTMEGWLKAVNAKTGEPLWKFKTPSGIIGNPMTYVGPDGKQYVAVLSGIGGWSGIGVAADIGAEDPTAGLGALGAFGDVANFSNQGGVLTVFSLPRYRVDAKLRRFPGWSGCLLCAPHASAQSGRQFRVCADPENLPFSNRQLEGFENKIADVIAKDLGASVLHLVGTTPGVHQKHHERHLEGGALRRHDRRS